MAKKNERTVHSHQQKHRQLLKVKYKKKNMKSFSKKE